MEILVCVLFIILVLPIILVRNHSIYKEHKQASGGIVNYDSFMRKFVFKINLTSREIIDLLITDNDVDDLSCTFDFEKSVVRISEYGSHIDYFFQIQEGDVFSILRLEQVALFGMQSSIPFKLNPYIVNKLQAETIPFSQYSF